MKNRANNYSSGVRASDLQDGVVAAPEHHRIIFENDKVRVLDTIIKAGEKVPAHTHSWPSVTYFLSVGDFIRRDRNGNVELDSRNFDLAVEPGAVMWLPALPLHSAENVGETDIRGITVELKQ